VARDDDHRQLRVLLVNPRQNLETIDPRHLDIEQYEVDASLLDGRQRLVTVLCQRDLVGFELEQPLQ
jgi:hypothetical protein